MHIKVVRDAEDNESRAGLKPTQRSSRLDLPPRRRIVSRELRSIDGADLGFDGAKTRRNGAQSLDRRTGSQSPTAIIIDSDVLFTDAIRSLLEAGSLCIIGTARTCAHGISIAVLNRPDLVILEVGIGGAGWLVVGGAIVERVPDSRVVGLASRADPDDVHEALRLGFHGFISKQSSAAQFLKAVRAVLAGELVVPSELARPLTTRPLNPEAHVFIQSLTERERDVLELLAEGDGTAVIASRLSVSVNTARTYVQNVLTKLQVHSQLEAAAFAVRHQLVPSRKYRR